MEIVDPHTTSIGEFSVKTLLRLILVLLILTLAAPLAHAQGTLTQTYVSPDGMLRIQLPAGWVVDMQPGQTILASSAAALAAENPADLPPGSVVMQIVSSDATASQFGATASAAIEALKSAIPPAGEVSSLTINGQPGFAYEYNVSVFEGMAGAVQLNADRAVAVAFATPSGEFAAFRETALAMLNSIRYTEPLLPALDTLPPLTASNANQTVLFSTIMSVQGTISAVDMSPDGTQAAIAFDDFTRQSVTAFVHVYRVVDNSIVFQHSFTSDVYDVDISPDGRLLVTAGGVGNLIDLWDLVAGGRATSPAIQAPADAIAVYALAFSQDGTRLAAGINSSTGHTVIVWDMQTGTEIKRLTGPTDFIEGLAFSPDGARLACGSKDGSLRVWDVVAGTEVFQVAEEAVGRASVAAVAFSPDGAVVAAGVNISALLDSTNTEQEPAASYVRLYEAATGTRKATSVKVFQSYQVTSLAFTADGSALVSGTQNAIQFWNPATAELIGTRMFGGQYVKDLALNASNARLVLGHEGEPGRLELWGVYSPPTN